MRNFIRNQYVFVIGKSEHTCDACLKWNLQLMVQLWRSNVDSYWYLHEIVLFLLHIKWMYLCRYYELSFLINNVPYSIMCMTHIYIYTNVCIVKTCTNILYVKVFFFWWDSNYWIKYFKSKSLNPKFSSLQVFVLWKCGWDEMGIVL